MITATETRKRARESLKGKWGKAALITLCFSLIEWLIGFIGGLAEQEEALSFILSMANIIISIPMTFGLVYVFIKLKRNEDVSAFDFLKLGFSNFTRSWKISLGILRKMILPMILIIVSIIIFVFGTFSASFGSESGTILLIVGSIALLASSIYSAIKGLYYTLSNYIAIDNPDMEAKDAVEESERLMNGHRADYFVLSLSFIGWAFLTVFTFGIGYLWLAPYIQVATVCFYEYLAGKDNVEVEAEVVQEK